MIASLRKQLQAGETTAAQLVQQVAADIATRDPQTGAYLTYDLDAALADAARADLSLPLASMPNSAASIVRRSPPTWPG